MIPARATFYKHLQECGYILIFKQTITVRGTIKGNCDAKLVLKNSVRFLYKKFYEAILITGDGDFGCLVEFLKEEKILKLLIAPDTKKCSILLKNKGANIIFLNDLYHKFSDKFKKEKAPMQTYLHKGL